ncbi:glycerophosphodiester phosphodiesterase family protein [Pontiellaceae bacterium B12227]|nr:glycerophosphodiester phosphodiesterase family protein [Pontiellaceae bacterium B12227]
MKSSTPEIIAHRGASYDAPENTLEAFQLGLDRRADAIECDVHLSSDGELMVIHDPTVDRTTNGTGRVAELTRTELGALDAGSWKETKWRNARIPTLPEVLDLVPADRRILIEVKVGPSGLPRLKEILDATTLPRDRIIVMEFDLETVIAMRAAFPDLEVLWLLDFPRLHLPAQKRRTLKNNIEYAANHGFDGVNIQNIPQLDAAAIAACKARDLKSYCWTVDDAVRTAELFKDGIDGVATNRPGWTREQLG